MHIALRPLLIAILGLAWLLPGLVGHDPWKPDEAYTFGVVYEILQGGSWVIPQIAGARHYQPVTLGTEPDVVEDCDE